MLPSPEKQESNEEIVVFFFFFFFLFFFCFFFLKKGWKTAKSMLKLSEPGTEITRANQKIATLDAILLAYRRCCYG